MATGMTLTERHILECLEVLMESPARPERLRRLAERNKRLLAAERNEGTPVASAEGKTP